jgi:multiple sugar transport system ATP-binding protein/alpha-glucoside transport system ATP-binding protein
MSGVVLERVEKAYGALRVIHGIDLEVCPGEFVVFVGPSGCGKSTLLRMIAGLEHITAGTVSIGGRVVNEVPSPRRGIAMVFQSYALYPHMSVRQNMAFGLEVTRHAKAEIAERVEEAARILQLGPYLDRMPKALSGGQRQRVAIGRAIVRKPDVFLFDEPLSNLDAALRGQTRVEIARLHSRLGATMIYVTHDQTEAMTLADRIVVLNGGQIEQTGTPLDLYRSPANAFVAGFIGGQKMNLLPITRDGTRTLLADRPLALGPNAERAVTLGIRPEHLRPAVEGEAHLSVRVEVVEQFGESALVHCIETGLGPVTVKLDGAPSIAPGSVMHLALPSEHLHLFDQDGRRMAVDPAAVAGPAPARMAASRD